MTEPPRRTGAARADWAIAIALLAAPALLIGAILSSAEAVKRETALSMARRIAAANLDRQARRRPLATGRIDNASPLVADGDIEPDDWEYMPYLFSGADDPSAPCVLASATRRTKGPRGAGRGRYAAWGACVDRNGRAERFEGRCSLDCRAPAPVSPPAPPIAPAAPRAPRVEPPRLEERPPEVPPRPARTLRAPVPEIPELPHFDAPRARSGCSATGCAGSSCCDPQTDACLSCPGAPCCDRGLGCNGVCYQDEDCIQGCRCVKVPGSPSGACRGG